MFCVTVHVSVRLAQTHPKYSYNVNDEPCFIPLDFYKVSFASHMTKLWLNKPLVFSVTFKNYHIIQKATCSICVLRGHLPVWLAMLVQIQSIGCIPHPHYVTIRHEKGSYGSLRCGEGLGMRLRAFRKYQEGFNYPSPSPSCS